MLCAWSSQYPHRPIPPDQSRSVEVNGTGSVVVPAPAELQVLTDHFVFSSDRARHSVWRLNLKLISDLHVQGPEGDQKGLSMGYGNHKRHTLDGRSRPAMATA